MKAITTEVRLKGEISDISAWVSVIAFLSAIAEKYRKSDTRSKIAIIGIAQRH